MKKLFLATVLLAVPAFAADSAVPRRIVREFVVNAGTENWWLTGGWSWSDGTLTHWSGSGKGIAEQRIMPALSVGHSYGIAFTHSGSSKGTVTISLGKASSIGYDWRGTFPVVLTVSDADALLTFTATDDYDGSISNIRVVELGEELVGKDALSTMPAPSQDGNAAPAVTTLSVALPVVAGHVYRVYFGVSDTAEADPASRHGSVSLGGWKSTFPRSGNYSFDIVTTDDSPLAINFEGDWFDGVVNRVSVRELVSDPVSADQAPSGTD
jgi:hypothetical protein